MALLETDLRCLDAHAHLGNLVFDHTPEEALHHYQVGVRIGELSLGANFAGVLGWGLVDNRPFLRCMQGYGSLPLAAWPRGGGRARIRSHALDEPGRQPGHPVSSPGGPRREALGGLRLLSGPASQLDLFVDGADALLIHEIVIGLVSRDVGRAEMGLDRLGREHARPPRPGGAHRRQLDENFFRYYMAVLDERRSSS